jgi:hypothetical protein
MVAQKKRQGTVPDVEGAKPRRAPNPGGCQTEEGEHQNQVYRKTRGSGVPASGAALF